MAKARICLLISFWCCWQYVNVHVAAFGTPHRTSLRSLQQEAVSERVATGVQVAYFSSLYTSQNLAADVEFSVPEFQLEGPVDVSSTNSEVALYGTHFLGPAEVQDLAEVVSRELPLVPPSQAWVTPVIEFPGVIIKGKSVMDTLSTKNTRRIPTVFAPFHAGTIFRVASREVPPGATLTFSNMTLLMPNVTYEGIYDSGFMDFFDLGRSARFCITNSILVLKSCRGYNPNIYHLWCCTARQCNILYTQKAIEDLGYYTVDLQFIQCFSEDEVVAEGSAADSEQGDTDWAAIGGGVSGAVAASVVVARAVLGVFVRYRRSRSCQAGSQELLNDETKAAGAPSEMSKAHGASLVVIPTRSITVALPLPPSAVAGVRTQTCGLTTSMAARTDAYNTAAAAAETTAAQQKARLVAELDHMRLRRELFLGQFVVLPCTERREGGQGVVQFMRRVRTEEAVAVKFFFSRTAFETECELYGVDVLRSMMPEVRLQVANANAAERNGRGYPWPPCMVLEKGESLQEWKAKTQPAFSTILDALCLIAERLAQLHGNGWVHRDLKPGNVLRLPGQHSWTLMDFGCAAGTGESAQLSFSASYAPPEVAEAAERGDRTVTADPAVDMWALGIMAFELLTGAPVFPRFACTRGPIWEQLCGREPLPWEEGAPGQAEKLAQLRVLKAAILQCLQRQPEARPTAQEVVGQWRRLFEPRSAGR